MKINILKIDLKLKIKNLKFEHESGFTLVEVLVVIGVFATIGAIVSAILVSSLRGTNKTNAIITVKENGNRALFFIANTIRYAKKFNGMTDGTIDPQTGAYKLYPDCTVYPAAGTSPTPTPAYYKGVKITSFDSQETIFMCCSNPPANIASLSASVPLCNSAGVRQLLDTTSVSMPTCSFTCSQQGSSDFPAIGVNFSLMKGGVSTLVEKMVNPIEFRTTIIMRNLYK